MANRPKPKIKLIQTAETAGAICAEISIDDVLQMQPAWSEGQARVFLSKHAAVIGEIMLLSALQTLEQLITNGETDA